MEIRLCSTRPQALVSKVTKMVPRRKTPLVWKQTSYMGGRILGTCKFSYLSYKADGGDDPIFDLQHDQMVEISKGLRFRALRGRSR